MGDAIQTIVIRRQGNPGILAGVLAALCSVIGLLRGLAGMSGSGIAVSLLGGVLTVAGFALSPSLSLIAGGLLVASQVNKSSLPLSPDPIPAQFTTYDVPLNDALPSGGGHRTYLTADEVEHKAQIVAEDQLRKRLAAGATSEGNAEALRKSDLLWKGARAAPGELAITLKEGEALSAILRDLGASPEEIKAISAVLGPLGRDGALKVGQKFRILRAPLRGSGHMQPLRVMLVGDTAVEAIVALTDIGKYVAVEPQFAAEDQLAAEDQRRLEAQAAREQEAIDAENAKAKASAIAGPPAMPQAEKLLIAAVEKARAAYAAGSNEMAKGAARPSRAKEICAMLKDFLVGGWIGEVETLSSNTDGLGVLSVRIANGISIKTWNNTISDFQNKTLIDPETAVFKQAVALTKGQRVTFGGQFFRDPTDCIREASLTLEGSLTQPEFIFRFSDLTAIE